MNQSRMTTIVARFLNDIVDEVDRAREKFPGNKHMMGAFHEEVGEVAKAMLEREYNAQDHAELDMRLDVDVYKECVQAAAMALRVATEGDPEYLYQNPHYRNMDGGVDPVDHGFGAGINVNDPNESRDRTFSPERDRQDAIKESVLTKPGSGEAIEININEVQIQIDSNNANVKLTHLPTGCFVFSNDYATKQENQAAGLKELSRVIKERLAWGPKDDNVDDDGNLVIPAFLRRGED